MKPMPVICTDRGSHPRTRLAKHDAATSQWWQNHRTGDRHLNTWIHYTNAGGNLVYIADCPRCPRNPQVPHDRLVRVAAMLAAAGQDVIDISYEDRWP